MSLPDDDKETKNADVEYRIINNPYLILIGVHDYDDTTNKSLPTVKQDIKHMQQLWNKKYKYKNMSIASNINNNKNKIPHNYKPSLSSGIYGIYKLQNGSKRMDAAPREDGKITAESLNLFLNETSLNIDENNDGLLLFYSGHIATSSSDNFIICSDNNAISFNDIQHIFSSQKCMNLRNKPKILYFNGYAPDTNQREAQKLISINNKCNDTDFFIHYQINNSNCLANAIYDCYTMHYDKLSQNAMTLNEISMNINKHIRNKTNIAIINRLHYTIYIQPFMNNTEKCIQIQSRATLLSLLEDKSKEMVRDKAIMNDLILQKKKGNAYKEQILRLTQDVINKNEEIILQKDKISEYEQELLRLKRKLNVLSDGWKSKEIDEWNVDDLEGWIVSLGLELQYEARLISEIRAAEVCGEDINSCESGMDIAESFDDIHINIGRQIYQHLEKRRRKSKSYRNSENDYHYDGDSKQNEWVLTEASRGIIGLSNLGNTCFINSVIQCLLQTPPLLKVLRKWSSNRSSHWWSGTSSSSMLDSFISVARAATQKNAKYNATAPSGIVRSLRNSDVRFEVGAQGDALSAVSKMIELLDKGIISRQKSEIKPMHKVINHPGCWYINYMAEDEEDSIIGNVINYNPYKSVVREKMHFVERNILSCMNAGCTYKESRYEFKEKILLPLYDHSVDVILDIYIPGIAEIIKSQSFNVLDYCCVDTLRHVVYRRISNILIQSKSNDNDKHFVLQSINQIKIKIMRANRNSSVEEWIKDVHPQNECKCFRNDNIYIFAVIESLNINNGHGSKCIVSIFNLFIDENGKIEPNKSYLEFDEMRQGAIKSFEHINIHNAYHKNVYFKQRLLNEENECMVDEYNKTVICLWTHEKMQRQSYWTNYDVQRKVFDAFTLADNGNKRYHKPLIQNDICGAFDVYLREKLLDRGAVLKCGECLRKSDVFRVETAIVRYSEILIFTIDRYIDGRKFTATVDYPHKLQYDNDNIYELYGVCNHSGTLRGGHYWAYVKGADNGNWYNANDSSIRDMDKSSVVNRASAIILMYKQIKNDYE